MIPEGHPRGHRTGPPSAPGDETLREDRGTERGTSEGDIPGDIFSIEIPGTSTKSKNSNRLEGESRRPRRDTTRDMNAPHPAPPNATPLTRTTPGTQPRDIPEDIFSIEISGTSTKSKNINKLEGESRRFRRDTTRDTSGPARHSEHPSLTTASPGDTTGDTPRDLLTRRTSKRIMFIKELWDYRRPSTRDIDRDTQATLSVD